MIYTAQNLSKDKHAFFSSKGGVSTGIFSSLNANYKSSDKKENIEENLNIIAKHFNLKKENINILSQHTHSNVAVFIETPEQHKSIADGAVTKNKDVLLAVSTADCAPVLFADYEHNIIGAAHSGWRGSVSGVLENTLDLMIKHGAKKETIHAAIGPCIQQKSFEVGEDVFQLAKSPKKFQPKDNGKYLFDMEGYIMERLEKYGIKSISKSGIDTYSETENFFSYRRNTHQKISAFPVQLSVIGL